MDDSVTCFKIALEVGSVWHTGSQSNVKMPVKMSSAPSYGIDSTYKPLVLFRKSFHGVVRVWTSSRPCKLQWHVPKLELDIMTTS